ncbi:MAG: hypothetical protein KDD70_06750 [Bdellovibrionales bacterium]|nr:hypothetical protein [Bdellovibrionales bacterium]
MSRLLTKFTLLGSIAFLILPGLSQVQADENECQSPTEISLTIGKDVVHRELELPASLIKSILTSENIQSFTKSMIDSVFADHDAKALALLSGKNVCSVSLKSVKRDYHCSGVWVKYEGDEFEVLIVTSGINSGIPEFGIDSVEVSYVELKTSSERTGAMRSGDPDEQQEFQNLLERVLDLLSNATGNAEISISGEFVSEYQVRACLCAPADPATVSQLVD